MADKFPADYRQGFLNGYQKAFDDLAALLKHNNDNLEEAQEICRAFWTNELSDWLANDGDLPVLAIPTESNREVITTVDASTGPHDPYEDKTA